MAEKTIDDICAASAEVRIISSKLEDHLKTCDAAADRNDRAHESIRRQVWFIMTLIVAGFASAMLLLWDIIRAVQSNYGPF